MTQKPTINWITVIGLPLAIILTSAGLALSSLLTQYPELAMAITYDLAITAPLIYLLLIWKKPIPKTTAVPVFLLGLAIATWLLPPHLQSHVSALKTYLFPVVELGVLSYVIITARKAIKSMRKHQAATPDFYTAVQYAANELMPKTIAGGFAMEVGIIYYGFINWRKRELTDQEFSYHKKSGTPAIMGAFIFLILVEVISVHFLLAMWSHTAAWILTGLSIYSGLQITGMARSLSKRPIGIEDHVISLRYGVLAEATIPRELIERVELSSKKLDEQDPLARKLSPLGELERHNVILYLTKPVQLQGMYGKHREAQTIALHVDDKERFVDRVRPQ